MSTPNLVPEMPQTLEAAQEMVAYLTTFSISVMMANEYSDVEIIETVLKFDDIWHQYESELLGTFGLKPSS